MHDVLYQLNLRLGLQLKCALVAAPPLHLGSVYNNLTQQSYYLEVIRAFPNTA